VDCHITFGVGSAQVCPSGNLASILLLAGGGLTVLGGAGLLKQ
jgi:hypothetical protein